MEGPQLRATSCEIRVSFERWMMERCFERRDSVRLEQPRLLPLVEAKHVRELIEDAVCLWLIFSPFPQAHRLAGHFNLLGQLLLCQLLLLTKCFEQVAEEERILMF